MSVVNILFNVFYKTDIIKGENNTCLDEMVNKMIINVQNMCRGGNVVKRKLFWFLVLFFSLY